MAKRKRDIDWADQRRELEKQVEHPYITKQGLDRNRNDGNEVFHKTLRTQSNHVFMAIYAAFSLEWLRIKHRMNALRSKLYLKAIRHAFDELTSIRKITSKHGQAKTRHRLGRPAPRTGKTGRTPLYH